MFAEVKLIEKEHALKNPGYQPQPHELINLLTNLPIEELRLTLQSYDLLRTRTR